MHDNNHKMINIDEHNIHIPFLDDEKKIPETTKTRKRKEQDESRV